MKKTLIVLFAAGGLAVQAAEPTPVVAADFAVTDFSTYKTETISGGGWTLNNANSNVTAGESLVFTNDVLFVGYSGDDLHNNNIVYTFELEGLTSATQLNALYTIHTTVSSNIIGLCLDSDNTSVLTGLAGGAQWPNGNNRDISFPTGAFTLTVAHTNNGTKVYIDGELKATISGLQYTSSNGQAHNMKQLNFGNSSSGSAGVNVTLNGLYIHNQTLTDAQVAAFVSSLSVPEPTTATLSLLALAGLAARRRRK